MTDAREPVDVTVTVNPLHGKTRTLSAVPDTIYLSPTRGADWLHQIIVEIRPDRVIVAVVPTEPHIPINKMTVRPSGAAVFTT